MGHHTGHSHQGNEKKDAVRIGAVLFLLFALTASGNALFVNGGGHGESAGHGPEITVYATQDECEKETGGTCFLKVCNKMSAQGGNEDICGQGYNREGWYPGKDAAHDAGATPAAH